MSLAGEALERVAVDSVRAVRAWLAADHARVARLDAEGLTAGPGLAAAAAKLPNL